MSNHSVGHNRNPADVGDGWTGVTDEDKRYAGWRAPHGVDADGRAWMAVQNTELVAGKWGSGHWSGGDGSNGGKS